MANRPLRRFLPSTAAVVVLIAVLVVLLATGGEQPPATGAVRLVPADALVYIHLSTDTGRPAVKRALALARRFPDYPLAANLVSTRAGAIVGGGRSVDFGTDIRPWLGKEAAFALLNTSTSTAGSLIVLDVRNRAKATSFVEESGAVSSGSYRGTALERYPSGTTVAFVRHYLVLGQAASVRSAIDASAGRLPALANADAYRHAASGEPADRVLDAYASVAGVRRVLAPQGGLLGALGVLLYQPALTGTTISASAVGGGLRLRVHGALDPTLARAGAPPTREFSPTLAGELPEGTTVLLDVMGLDRVAPRVLGAGAAGGIAGRIGPLLQRLGAALNSEGVPVSRVTSLFSGETAVAVSPAVAAKGSLAARGPALEIVARTKNEASTRQLLARVEAPLAQLFPPPANGPGQVPEFSNVSLAGITAHQLRLAPGLQLDYAVFRGLVVVATSLQAIAGVARHAHSLSDESAYGAVLRDRPDPVSSLVFLDFNQLLSLAEQAGLTSSSRVAALRPDLEKIQAIGLTSTRGEADTTAELLLHIP
jgi:Protein of unknown function (DUF3352)